MSEKLGLFFCNNLVPEVAEVLKTGNYPDVKLMSFRDSCIASTLDNDSIANMINPSATEFSKILFFVSACRKGGKSNVFPTKNVDLIHLEQCFEIFLNKEIIYHFIRQGYYLVSNGWLNRYKHHIAEWDFEEKSARTFFRESLKKILFLDTGLGRDYQSKLEALSEYMGLPYEVFPVGLSHCRNYIESKISQWRFENERTKMNLKLAGITKENANYFFVFQQLQKLVDYTDEAKIVKEVFNLLNILFAPQQITFQAYDNGRIFEKKWLNGNAVPPKKDSSDYMAIQIVHQNEVLGEFEVYGIKFPEYIDQYQKTGNIISIICGVAMSNARKYKIIQDQNEELTKLNAEKDKFFSIIAHDLKSPFNSILGFSDLLVEQISEKNYDGLDEYAEIIQQSSSKAMDLLRNLMEWAQSQTGKMEFNPEFCKVKDLIKDTELLLSGAIKQKSIKFSTKSSVATVFADKKMISTVLRNLVSNAIKFTNTGGEITLSAHEKQNELMVSVQDTGVGIPQDRVKKLFSLSESRSTTGTNKEKGTGLGLILCKEFVEKHGGRIWVESDPDGKSGKKGSTFFFTLPCNINTQSKIPKPDKSKSEARPKIPETLGLKVLIAEDDETSEKLLSIEMKKFSREILKTISGKEAIEICRKNPDIDLVLMDIQMPGINGYEATRQIREFNKEVVIIAQTSFALSGDRGKALEAGCNDYISKPVKKRELQNLIKKYFVE